MRTASTAAAAKPAGSGSAQPTATGMLALRGLLDPEGAAIIKAAIDPLAAPAPETDEHGRTTPPDDRSPARRRLEALLTIVQRGVAAADGVPTTDKAKVVVLITLHDLTNNHDDHDYHDDTTTRDRRSGARLVLAGRR